MWYDTTDSVCIPPCYLSARKQEIPEQIQYPVWMSLKPRKRVFRALKSDMAKNSGRGARETAAAISYLRNKHGD